MVVERVGFPRPMRQLGLIQLFFFAPFFFSPEASYISKGPWLGRLDLSVCLSAGRMNEATTPPPPPLPPPPLLLPSPPHESVTIIYYYH